MKLEREFSFEEAEDKFEHEVKKLKLRYELKKLGLPPYQTTACYLFCDQNKVSEGGGKGIGKQSELSAKFEALENFTGQVSFVSSPYESFSLSQIQTLQMPILSSKIFPDLSNYADSKIPWISYSKIGSEDTAFLPAVCAHPFYYRNPYLGDHFDYTQLYLSGTTNGFATGCTKTEALIHAILEVVERHSISLVLIDDFVNCKVPNNVDLKTLPINLQTIANHITHSTGYDLLVYQMPNEMDIPVYGVLLNHPNLAVPIKGSGASLSASYALERALLEALECYHWDPHSSEHEKALEKLKEWPDLQKCVKYNFSKGPQVPFVNSQSINFSPEKYLDKIISKLNAQNFSLYVHEAYSSENLTTVHVVIPQAEEFFAITMGIVVPIKEKGRQWAKR